MFGLLRRARRESFDGCARERFVVEGVEAILRWGDPSGCVAISFGFRNGGRRIRSGSKARKRSRIFVGGMEFAHVYDLEGVRGRETHDDGRRAHFGDWGAGDLPLSGGRYGGGVRGPLARLRFGSGWGGAGPSPRILAGRREGGRRTSSKISRGQKSRMSREFSSCSMDSRRRERRHMCRSIEVGHYRRDAVRLDRILADVDRLYECRGRRESGRASRSIGAGFIGAATSCRILDSRAAPCRLRRVEEPRRRHPEKGQRRADILHHLTRDAPAIVSRRTTPLSIVVRSMMARICGGRIRCIDWGDCEGVSGRFGDIRTESISAAGAGMFSLGATLSVLSPWCAGGSCAGRDLWPRG